MATTGRSESRLSSAQHRARASASACRRDDLQRRVISATVGSTWNGSILSFTCRPPRPARPGRRDESSTELINIPPCL